VIGGGGKLGCVDCGLWILGCSGGTGKYRVFPRDFLTIMANWGLYTGLEMSVTIHE